MIKYFDFVLSNKKLFSGIAIILILCYHLLCTDESVSLYWIFYAGFIGVDIFMYFSGYTLCYSFEKNTITRFYWRRLKRIAPLFIVLALSISTLYVIRGSHLTVFDWFCNVTTLSYYQLGGQFIDWYLSSLFLFYLLFPLFFKIVDRIGWGGQIIVSIVICTILSIFDIPWYYGAALARVPMFMTGIQFFVMQKRNKKEDVNKVLWFIIPLALSITLYVLGTPIGGYMITDMFTPFLLLGLAWVIVCLNDRRTRFLGLFEILGKYSLEIYISNVIVMMIVKTWVHGSLNIFLAYMTLSLLMAFLILQLNKQITKVIK